MLLKLAYLLGEALPMLFQLLKLLLASLELPGEWLQPRHLFLQLVHFLLQGFGAEAGAFPNFFQGQGCSHQSLCLGLLCS